jgi:septum site-determining protein MinD
MKIIGLISGKGGVGKTSSAVNLAAGLNFFGKDVVIVDGNVTTPNVGLHFGSPVVPVSLHHVLKGEKKITEAIYRHPSGVSFIPGGLSINDLEGLKLHKLKQIQKLNCDYVLLDGAAGLGSEALNIMKHSEELFVVTNAEIPAITDALKAVKVAEQLNKHVSGIILTRTKEDDLDVSVRNVEAMIERPVVAVIPEDDTLREALCLKDAVVHTHPEARASRAYLKLAAAMTNSVMPEKKKQTVWEKVRTFFKR